MSNCDTTHCWITVMIRKMGCLLSFKIICVYAKGLYPCILFVFTAHEIQGKNLWKTINHPQCQTCCMRWEYFLPETIWWGLCEGGGDRRRGSAQQSLQRCSLGPAIQLRAAAGESREWRARERSSVLLRGTCGLGLNALAGFGLFQWLHSQGRNFQCHHLIMWLFSLYPSQSHWLLL